MAAFLCAGRFDGYVYYIIYLTYIKKKMAKPFGFAI